MLVVPMDGRASVEVHFFIAQRYWCQVNDHLHFKASKCCDTYYNNKMNPRAQLTSGALLFLTLLQCLEVVKSSVQPFPSHFEGGLLFLHTGELCGKRRPWLKFCIIENRQEPFCFLDSFSVQKSLKAVSSRFQVILRGVFVFYIPGGLSRKRRPWSKFCRIEDIVVSYTSKVEIPISRYL